MDVGISKPVRAADLSVVNSNWLVGAEGVMRASDPAMAQIGLFPQKE